MTRIAQWTSGSSRIGHNVDQNVSSDFCSIIFVREHGVHAGPKDYFVVVVVCLFETLPPRGFRVDSVFES
jgi:hypothetical protein